MKLGTTIFFFLLTGSILNATTKEIITLNDTIALNEVVVSATKTAVNRSEIPLTMSVIDKQIIDESIETGVLSILSEHVPGLFVTERGVTGYGVNNGSAGMVNIHGVGGGNKVLMLFDGQPNWAGVFGHAIPDAYVASDAERVEVIRGPASLLYGSNAMGGVINVITRKANTEGLHGRARAMYGAYNTWKIMGNAGYKHDKFHAMVSLNRDQSEGHRPNSAFDINNGYIKIGYQFSNHWETTANALIADFEIHNPGPVDALVIENWAKAHRSTYSVSLNNHYEKLNGALQLFYNDGQHYINDGWKNDTPRLYFFRSSDFNRGFALFESFRLLKDNIVTVGLDAKQWGGRAWNDSINGNQQELMNRTVNETAGYALVQQNLWEKLSFNAGLRLEHNSIYGNEWIPQAGIAYRLNSQTSFKTSLSKGFRSPNVNELFSPWGSNPNLKPEEMNNFDFSYLQSLFDSKLNFELNTFYAKGKNLIMRVNQQNQNSGKFINQGIDFAVNYQILPQLKFSGNYSFLYSKSDIQIVGAPKHKAYFALNWNYKQISLAPNLQYINGLYTDTNSETMENYTLLNCKINYHPTPQLHFFINGENLTGATYQIYSGYPMPGTVVLAGFDVKF